MSLLEATSPGVHRGAKTCDIGRDIGHASRAESCGTPMSCETSSRVRGLARNPGSFTPESSSDGRDAERRSRLAADGKRCSWSLTRPQTTNLLDAADWALEIGLPLNRFVTINWETAGVADCTKATGRFLKHAGDWLRRRGHRIAYLWVQESGARVGQHVHMLIHVPPDLARRFSQLQRRWLKASGASFCKDLIRSRPVGHSYRAAMSSAWPAYYVNLERVLRYMLKQSWLGDASSGGPRKACQSLVRGKRCGTSENIGARARAQEARDARREPRANLYFA